MSGVREPRRREAFKGLRIRERSRYVASMPTTTRPRRITPVDHDPAALKWARENAGWRQAELARKVGISPSLLCEAEKGTRGLHPAVMKLLAQEFQCPVSMLRRKDEPR